MPTSCPTEKQLIQITWYILSYR